MPEILANRLIRRMTDSGAMLEIGADGFALVAMVAMAWDGILYARPVAYRLPQLLERMALKNKQAFYRIEERCLKAGWLLKTAQGTRLPILYTVAIPEQVKGRRFDIDEGGSTDDPRTNKSTESGPINGPIPGLKADQSRTNPDPSPSVSLSSREEPRPNPGDAREEPDQMDLMTPAPKREATDAEVLGMLSIHAKWFHPEKERLEENKALLIRCYRVYGALCLQVAEAMRYEAGERVYADRLADQLASVSADQKRTNVPPPEPTLYEAAAKIVRRDGWKACRARLSEWWQGLIAPGEKALLDALHDNQTEIAAALIAASKGAA